MCLLFFLLCALILYHFLILKMLGFNNITERIPPTLHIGKEQNVMRLTELLRFELAGAGFIEALTFGLCAEREAYSYLKRKNVKGCVKMANPMDENNEIVRPCLLPGLLKTIACNREVKCGNGLRLFEVSDVCVLDDTSDTGAKNERHACIVYTGKNLIFFLVDILLVVSCFLFLVSIFNSFISDINSFFFLSITGPTAGLEIIHGVVDRLFELLKIRPESVTEKQSMTRGEIKNSNNETKENKVSDPIQRYILEECQSDTYFPQRSANVLIDNGDGSKPIKIGEMGVLHPEVLTAFGLGYPVSCVEIDLEMFVNSTD